MTGVQTCSSDLAEKSVQTRNAGPAMEKWEPCERERERAREEREKRGERGETEGNVFFSSSPLGLRLEILAGFTEDSVLCC